MKKLTFTLFIALAVACLFSVPCNAKGKAKHVVFIGLDGWGSYSVPKAEIQHDLPFQTENTFFQSYQFVFATEQMKLPDQSDQLRTNRSCGRPANSPVEYKNKQRCK